MKMFLLPEDLRNDLLAYLVSRPFVEVARGVVRLENLPEYPSPKAEAPALAVVPKEE